MYVKYGIGHVLMLYLWLLSITAQKARLKRDATQLGDFDLGISGSTSSKTPFFAGFPLVNEHNYGKSPRSTGELTISMAMFQFAIFAADPRDQNRALKQV